jgi:predicted Ser/Thr protein kinase
MTPERYRRLNELFHAVLGLPVGPEREDFLGRECAGDDELRRKVEALVAADERRDFLDAPAFEAAAPLLFEAQDVSLVGRRLGHYQVLAPLGAGGMGDVYLARDTRLGRRVALKLLPEYVSEDESRVRRFLHEARAASSLNHPNIITVYDIGNADGRRFIATEYVEGVTLRRRMEAGRMSLDEVLGVALQLADVLSKAHQAGITHRDIKPENIMIAGGGLVKVLDFGLAKYRTPPGAGRDKDSQWGSTLTSPGMIMGTPAYMSPEQARGLETDTRTDIWSLGVVLYEMVAGRTPFGGPTATDLLAAIIGREPEPLAAHDAAAPAELSRIVARALRKELSERYQTAEELAADLERLRRELGTGAEAVREATLPARAPSPAGRRRRRAALLSLLAALCAAGALTFGWWRARHTDNAADAPPAPAAAASAERRLSYWLLVQKQRDGRPSQEPFRLAGASVFERDSLIRLNLRGSQDGHLYILNEGPPHPGAAASFVVLFPSPTANEGASLLPAGREIQIPERSWFRFDGERRTENVWLVWSAASVPALDAVKGFANPLDKGVVKDPALNSAVGEFLRRHAASTHAAEEDAEKKETVIKWEGDILAHILRLEHR